MAKTKAKSILLAPPTHRHRGKSAPRGKSPDPKGLRKAAAALETPPPKTSKGSSGSGAKTKDPVKRRISFGEVTEHRIKAENGAGPYKPGESGKADAIWKKMREDWFWGLADRAKLLGPV